ncbi:hypothetical protein mru_1022 [Methanobrevibacter ruminantium M1]|uniref:Uncharacterized protein n=1 Tax=Methanobrevibacter ruminantium (strain ATCC 35063 / DSM 1093 / JCM 13430 / OCM 146 / M1) TaxID=634498 RepID=D3E2W2_METRM|nr:hypothetical protein [Methanobrevibacter ruminantium]ADC46873.1 hypothetical protein mru_1022 [Methanobrevibacter ruminantium M1]
MANEGGGHLKTILMIIILIAFICGLALGVSVIMGGDDNSQTESEGVHYVNVTKNITEYNESGNLIETEDGTHIEFSSYSDNVTEGENVTAYNSSTDAGNLF